MGLPSSGLQILRGGQEGGLLCGRSQLRAGPHRPDSSLADAIVTKVRETAIAAADSNKSTKVRIISPSGHPDTAVGEIDDTGFHVEGFYDIACGGEQRP